MEPSEYLPRPAGTRPHRLQPIAEATAHIRPKPDHRDL